MKVEKESQGLEIVLSTHASLKKYLPFGLNAKKESKPEHSKEDGGKEVKNEVRYRSKTRLITIGLIISLSAMMFGYSLKQITSIPINTIMLEYQISLDKSVAQAILIGILPLGACIGAIITPYLSKKYHRLTGIYLFGLVNIGAIVLINITHLSTLLIGRFLEGICVGFYSSMSPVYLRQIAPKELRRLLGLFFSFGKIIGVIFVIVLELILESIETDIGWRIILSMTALLALLQAILIFFFGSPTVVEMIEKGRQEQAREIVEEFYHTEYIEEVMKEYINDYEAEINKERAESQNLGQMRKNQRKNSIKANVGNLHPTRKMSKIIHEETSNDQIDAMSVQENPMRAQLYREQQKVETKVKVQEKADELTFEGKKNLAFCLGIHLSIIRHFCGGNTIISQGQIFIAPFDANLGKYTSLILNLVQLAAIICGLLFISRISGKRPQFLISIAVLALVNIGLAIALIFQNQIALMALMLLFMIVYGGAFISPIWSYPSEIIPAAKNMCPNIFHWLALAISTLIPPLVTGAIGNPYPVFIFYGIYSFVGFLHVFRYLRESDGFTYKEIIKGMH